ncbi:MAG: hypothetical protein R2795_11275 [Saprospiraceae bacterium]
MQEGIITKSTGSWYNVLLNDGSVVLCRIIGKFRQDDKRLTNPIAVGDRVDITMEDVEQDTGVIRRIHPRNNYVVRQSPQKARATPVG